MAASNTPNMGGIFDPAKDVNFTGAVDFANVPTQGSASVVTTTGTQTLTNKTLTTPAVTNLTGSFNGATGSLASPTITTPTVSLLSTTIAAAGSSQGDGAITTARPCIIVVTAANTTKAVTLPAAVAGNLIILQNSVTDQNLNVFPAAGGIINALSSNASYVMAGAKVALFACQVTGTWFTCLTA